VSTLAFLSPAAADPSVAIARSPMERLAQAAGAQFEVRDGWNVAVSYGAGEKRALEHVAWADMSHLSKSEVRGDGVGGELGTARREGEGWWCGVTGERALVLGNAAPTDGALDVTCNYAALTILGPQARETIARFCALDLRPHVAPPGSFRPGSVARQPGMILVEGPDRFLLLFGWAVGEYVWTVVADAAGHLGGGPVGLSTLAPVMEAPARA
jgi:glycine cleavage system aminomethyltransferase T